MVEIMKMMFLVAFLLLHAESVEGYEFRLLKTNSSQDTDGFVEIFYNGSWGLIGNPKFRFSDDTASLLCRKFKLSMFGYGAIDIHIAKITFSHFWLQKLECNGNEQSIDECVKTDEFNRIQYIDTGPLLQDYGSKLYCVDYRLMGGLSQNTGMLLAAFNNTQHSMCYQGFDSNAGDVVCKHLRYNGLVNFTEGDPGLIPLFNNTLTCTGNESSLNGCTMSNAVIDNCTRAVYITCKAVRLTTWNDYKDEGTVDIFYNGSWGLHIIDSYGFNYVTAKFLCKTFGFGNVGFSSRHRLPTKYVGTGWWKRDLLCNVDEADIMQCVEPLSFEFVPYVRRYFYKVPWLYCFDLNITSMRLVNGPTPNEGDVELQVGGRWGSIEINSERRTSQVKTVGSVVCKILGYVGVSEIVHPFVIGCNMHTWMSYLICNGNEIDLTDCHYLNGGTARDRLAVKCEDTDQCQSNPCLNNSTCVDGDRSYTCNCTERWSGINCEIDIDECLSQPCKNNGSCVDAINGFVCYCEKGYEGYRCQNEVGDQTTLIVVLISTICVLSIVVLATVCCCIMYRRKHKKTKTVASNVLNSGKGGLQNTKEVEAVQTEIEEGQYNEDVYDGIKENTVADVADYTNPVTGVVQPRDADGYVKFADNDESVGYYKLKHTKTEDYSKLSGQKF